MHNERKTAQKKKKKNSQTLFPLFPPLAEEKLFLCWPLNRRASAAALHTRSLSSFHPPACRPRRVLMRLLKHQAYGGWVEEGGGVGEGARRAFFSPGKKKKQASAKEGG